MIKECMPNDFLRNEAYEMKHTFRVISEINKIITNIEWFDLILSLAAI